MTVAMKVAYIVAIVVITILLLSLITIVPVYTSIREEKEREEKERERINRELHKAEKEFFLRLAREEQESEE